ncbi:MAG TPA: ATP synthase subunit I [Ramlibacter sp.]|jgi:ATP synthase protein I|uniref:ATP synthase subunit I n=1 Tax=Ramlibacter sp. TaxID=1917967 RepID=UPI002D67F03A|nr:ATP synthase subunit I [Ramlibacter sp.]HZY16848.1 ATP synthase subunit I [Ramlibacter sp.]
MSTRRVPPLPDNAEEASPIQPLSAEEARRLRERRPPVSPWRVVAGQAAAGMVAAAMALLASGRPEVGWSVAWGVFVVAFPAAVFARALARRSAAGRAGVGFLAWELVKIGLSVALLVASPRAVPGLSWLAMVVGMVVATKMYWVALVWTRRDRRNGN